MLGIVPDHRIIDVCGADPPLLYIRAHTYCYRQRTSIPSHDQTSILNHRLFQFCLILITTASSYIMASILLISLLILSSSSLAFPTQQTTIIFSRGTGSSTLPYCQYDDNDNTKGNGKCPVANWGSPNPDYCQRSINFVCLALSQRPAVNNSIWGY